MEKNDFYGTAMTLSLRSGSSLQRLLVFGYHLALGCPTAADACRRRRPDGGFRVASRSARANTEAGRALDRSRPSSAPAPNHVVPVQCWSRGVGSVHLRTLLGREVVDYSGEGFAFGLKL